METLTKKKMSEGFLHLPHPLPMYGQALALEWFFGEDICQAT